MSILPMPLAKIIGSKLSEKYGELAISGLCEDSRKVKKGDLFFSRIGGERAQGFVEQAVERGAVFIIAGEGEAQNISVPHVLVENPSLLMARAAACFFAPPPKHMIAITGTNGKSSIAEFVRQIMGAQSRKAASIGTLGVCVGGERVQLSHTTPPAIPLHEVLAGLAKEGVEIAAMEASSHALSQFRLDGLCFQAAGFSNMSHDHLDYHKSFENYFAAKLRLFTELLHEKGKAVIAMDAPYGKEMAEAISGKREILPIGKGGEIELVGKNACEGGQELSIRAGGERESVFLPLLGAFQAENALLACGLAVAVGVPVEHALSSLSHLRGVKGRIQRIGEQIIIDYAHSPHALLRLLQDMRPHISGRLILVFGCGGERDREKRAYMGEIAEQYADIVLVTDDNPRFEEASAIRAEILASCPKGKEIDDRKKAILEGFAMLAKGDMLVIAGKGHEESQIIGERYIPFSDAEIVSEILAKAGA